MMPECRLCHHNAEAFLSVKDVEYLKCSQCGLRFMAVENLPDLTSEKAHYDHHKNDSDDQGYRDFLSRLLTPLTTILSQEAHVLDYGSGPSVSGKETALARMMRECGYSVSCFDPIYHNDPTYRDRHYDAVTATEVIEHFHYPRRMFDHLHALLKPGGILAVMTLLQTDEDDFAEWHYRCDPTHVAFYREESFLWLANHYGYTLTRPHQNVAFFQKAVLS